MNHQKNPLKNQMNSTERLKAILNGSPVDRTPFFTFTLGFCARNVGYPVASIYNDAERSFFAQLWTQEQYGYDSGPFYGYASYGGEEFGGKINFPEGEYEQAPSHKRFAVNTETDVYKLVLPDVQTAGMIPEAMKFSQLQDKHNIPITLVVGGPFTIAGNICPVEILCRWLIKNPKPAERLLDLAVEHILEVTRYWADSFGPERIHLQIWEPLASNQIISPKLFETFVFPRQKELNENILSIGYKYILCHICGEQNQNLGFWAQIPMGDPGIASFGREVDLSDAIKYFGKQCIIAGNIDPTIIQTGTPQEVYDLCRQAIEKGQHAPRGYILMPGCELPVGTPPYNLHMMVKAVHDFG